MRATVYGLLTGTPGLTDLVPAERWFEAGAVLDTPVKPFVVLRWLSPVPLSARSFGNQLRVEVHGERGDYTMLDDFNDEVVKVLGPLEQLVGSDGRVTQCDYLGHSGDQEHPEYRSNYKFTSWQVIGVRQ